MGAWNYSLKEDEAVFLKRQNLIIYRVVEIILFFFLFSTKYFFRKDLKFVVTFCDLFYFQFSKTFSHLNTIYACFLAKWLHVPESVRKPILKPKGFILINYITTDLGNQRQKFYLKRYFRVFLLTTVPFYTNTNMQIIYQNKKIITQLTL